jgi:hypothetical protein
MGELRNVVLSPVRVECILEGNITSPHHYGEGKFISIHLFKFWRKGGIK